MLPLLYSRQHWSQVSRFLRHNADQFDVSSRAEFAVVKMPAFDAILLSDFLKAFRPGIADRNDLNLRQRLIGCDMYFPKRSDSDDSHP